MTDRAFPLLRLTALAAALALAACDRGGGENNLVARPRPTTPIRR